MKVLIPPLIRILIDIKIIGGQLPAGGGSSQLTLGASKLALGASYLVLGS